MQAIKEKLSDFNAARHAKAEAKEGEKAEKEMAKARMEVAREVRMAREAEAAMDLHVNRAVEKAAEHERKHPKAVNSTAGEESYGRNPCNSPTAGGSGYLTDPMSRGGGSVDPTAAASDDARASPTAHNHSL